MKVSGAVLVGGKSSRFGSDKASFEVSGVKMANIVADTMRRADINDICIVGDDPTLAHTLQLTFVADEFSGEGPLGGILSAMRSVLSTNTRTPDILCVMPCDVPLLRPSNVTDLLSALAANDNADGAILVSDQEHWLCSAWRIATSLPVLSQRFFAGERALHRAVSDLRIQSVSASISEMLNVNTVADATEIDRTQREAD